MESDLDNDYINSLSHLTPFFIFSKKALISAYNDFTEHFPKALIAYAIKANSEKDVLHVFSDEGASFEAASIYELEMLKAIGVKAENIVYGTSVKPTAHIRAFADYGVDRFAFDSMSELEKIAAVVPGGRVYVRTAVDDAGSVFPLSEKFGASKSNILPMLIRARELELIPWGISFHVGSQALNPKAWAEAILSISSTVEELEQAEVKIEILNIGGGFPHAYPSSTEVASLKDIAISVHEAIATLSHKPRLMLEPGRALVAAAGTLVVSVIAKIERNGKPWLFLDAGAYNALFETMAFQGCTRYRVTLLRPSFNAGEGEFTLTGPTGDSIDTITHEARLPLDVDVGDKLVFRDVGAYSTCLASSFNGFPKPSVYFT